MSSLKKCLVNSATTKSYPLKYARGIVQPEPLCLMMCTCQSRPHTRCIEKGEACMGFAISRNRGLANQLARDLYNGISCLHPQELEKTLCSLEKGGSEDPKQPEDSNTGCFANRSYTTCTSAMRLTNERMAPHNRTSRACPLPSPSSSSTPA